MQRKFLLFILLSVVLTGCAGHPQLAEEPRVLSHNSHDQVVVYADNSLYLLDRETDTKRFLSQMMPGMLAWDNTGETLAVIFAVSDYESKLVRYSADGRVLFDKTLPVAVNDLAWIENGSLLVVGYRFVQYSFGANLQQVLYRFDNNDGIEQILADTTLRPGAAKQISLQPSAYLQARFLPASDELYYVRLHDPPEFAPYMVALTLNWRTGLEKALSKVPLQAVTLTQGVDNRMTILFSDGRQVFLPKL